MKTNYKRVIMYWQIMFICFGCEFGNTISIFLIQSLILSVFAV